MSAIMYRNTITAVCVFALLSQCSVSLAQSSARNNHQQQRYSVLKRNKQDNKKSGVQLNAPKAADNSNMQERANNASVPKTIKNPYVSEFNPLEIMDARPIGSAAIPDENQSTVPAYQKNAGNSGYRNPGNFAQPSKRRNNSYTIARLTDQPSETEYRDVETPPELNSYLDKSTLSSSSHFSVAQLEAKVTGPASLRAGQFGQYKILVRNVSPAFAENTELYVDLPKGSRIKTDKTFRPQQTNTGVLFKLGKIRPNQPLVIPFHMSLPRNGAVQVIAYLRYSGSTQMTVDVTQPSAAQTIEIAGATNAALRESLTYALMINNTTNSTATFTVRAKLPAGLNLTVLDRNAGVNTRTGLTTWTVSNLAPGATETIQFKAAASTPGRLTLVADVLSGNRQIANQSFTTTINR